MVVRLLTANIREFSLIFGQFANISVYSVLILSRITNSTFKCRDTEYFEGEF
jgi:hypothetical protein